MADCAYRVKSMEQLRSLWRVYQRLLDAAGGNALKVVASQQDYNDLVLETELTKRQVQNWFYSEVRDGFNFQC